MAERILFKCVDPQGGEATLYTWRVLSEIGEWRGDAGTGSLADLQAVIGEQELGLWWLVSGARVSTRVLPVSAKEKRHMHKLLPYQLEDDLACEVERLHFAFAAARNDEVEVAYVDQAWFASQMATFESAGLVLAGALAEPWMLPTDNNSCTLSLFEDLQIRFSNGACFSVEAELRERVLNQLHESLPEDANLLLVAADDAGLDVLTQGLALELRERITHRYHRDNWGALNIHAERVPLQMKASQWFSLCQGTFSRRLPIANWLHQWRQVGIFAAVALVVFLTVNFLQVQQLKAEQAELQAGIESAFRSVVPRGAMVDPLRQLRTKLRGTQVVANNSESVALLAVVAPALDEAKSIKLQGLQYNHDRNELRLNVQAPAFNLIEALRNRLDGKGVTATLMSASAQNGVHSARLKIEKTGA